MALILYMLGRTHSPFASNPNGQTMERKRLQKAQKNRKTLYSCKDIFEVVRSQSCLTIFTDDDDDQDLEADQKENTQTNPTNATKISKPNRSHVGYMLRKQPSIIFSEDSMSIYSTDEMEHQQVFTRTRPKTPVFLIGQLERKSLVKQYDKAQALAVQYQAELPARPITPFLSELQQDTPKLTPKKLRKIKCQVSLRDLIKSHSQWSPTHSHQRSPSTSYSDSDTLVGSDSPESPTFSFSDCKQTEFPLHSDAHVLDLDLNENSNNDKLEASEDLVNPGVDTEAGLKICMDLLTNELATTLFRQHPAEREDRASGLQILLLIEAYETVQRHVRQKLHDTHVMGVTDDHVETVERILANWLKVLYSVYDKSQECRFKKIEDRCRSRDGGYMGDMEVASLKKSERGTERDRREWEDIFISLC